MANSNIVTIDLNFQNKPQAIASYLMRGKDAIVLIESGPGSTLPALTAALANLALSPRDITHVLLTHIHLDHAGAAGWLSRQGAEIYVHPNGAAHLLNPEKLIASATRIYGERMEMLWGEFLPVEQNQLKVPKDAEEISIGNLNFLPVNTPGHADHHYAYLFEDLCFSGDVGGVRIPGFPYLRAPMPPPELHFGKWRASIQRLQALKFKRIAPTHFGIYDDAAWHLQSLQKNLDAAENWLEGVMPKNPSIEELREEFTRWMETQAREEALSADVVESFQLANPLGMSADGLARYWKKFRTPEK
ncbi:MAG: MBL fold metallo-hydrolase [Anaerolineales bacterium]|nr:MBL fold metallo-hydrolase [Anaerolineales bacterium]